MPSHPQERLRPKACPGRPRRRRCGENAVLAAIATFTQERQAKNYPVLPRGLARILSVMPAGVAVDILARVANSAGNIEQQVREEVARAILDDMGWAVEAAPQHADAGKDTVDTVKTLQPQNGKTRV
jgi:hypothetical protein